VVRNDGDAAGDLAEQAAEKIAAACWILGSRLRARSGPTRRVRMMERMEQRWRRRQEGNGGVPGQTRGLIPQWLDAVAAVLEQRPSPR